MSDDDHGPLWDGNVPADALRHYAEFGSEAQIVEVAANDSLPNEIALWIAGHSSVAARETLAMNTNVSAEVVERLLMYADLDRNQLLSHPNAPISDKLQAPLDRLTDYSLDLFFEDVNATDAERLLVRARRVTLSAAQTTLGEVWAGVRG